MTPRHPRLPAALTSVATVLLPLAAASTPATAAPATYAGGTRAVDHHLATTAMVPEVSPRAVADCPAGWFCFYDGRNYTGHRGKLSSCGYQDLATYGWNNRIESVYYDMRNGRVTFYNDGPTDTALFTVSVATPGDTDVSPHRDKADYVYRAC